MATNKKIGNDFETEFCELLFDKGFWCHLFAQNQAGQPADVIAVRNGDAYLIDCKECSSNVFPLSRIEENQTLSMELWSDSGNGKGWFALKIEGEIVMMNQWVLKALSHDKSVLNTKDIHDNGTSFEKWLKKCK